MAISKIILNGVTQMDVTDTTATAPTVEAGLYFYGADGEKTLGTGSGGGTVEAVEKDVNFLDDYDGIIVYSYTAAEFANLSELPANPTHAGMTSQGWNWTLSDAKTYVASYGKLWIGQQYVTTSGDTEIDIYLKEGRLSPYLGLAVNGTVSVDWGDETTQSTITGTNLTTQIRTLHNYSEHGLYTITISVISGEFAFRSAGTYPVLSKNINNNMENRVYATSVKRVRMGNNANISTYAFGHCHSLESITIPKETILIGTNAFIYCYSLKSVTIPIPGTGMSTEIPNSTFGYCYNMKRVSMPSAYTSIGQTGTTNVFTTCSSLTSVSIPSETINIAGYAFNGCYSLIIIKVPSKVETIGANCFTNCCGLSEIHFAPTSPPVVDNSNAFSAVPTDCVIYVPYSADHSVLAAYRSATNYPDPNTYTYTEE